jgi:hypothetical protein
MNNKYSNVKKFILSTSTAILSFGMLTANVNAKEVEIDRLTITSIKLIKPAGGIDSGTLAGMGALGAIVAGGATALAGGAVVVGTGGAAIGTVPVTALATAKAAAGGASTAIAATQLLDSSFSGQDDLIVKVNGHQVLPHSGGPFESLFEGAHDYQPMVVGQAVTNGIYSSSFHQSATIQLIEHDSGSNHDDLGEVVVHSNAFDNVVEGKKSYTMTDVIINAPHAEDGSIYYISYRVDRREGNYKDVVKYQSCGTKHCLACKDKNCNVH